MINLLLVDDHPMFRAGALATMTAESDINVVGEAASASDALDIARSAALDVVLTYIRLKGGVNGLEFARRLRRERPDVKIIVLTNFCNQPYVRAMMEVGVEGYVLKDTPAHEVVESIRMVMAGRTVLSDRVTQVIVGGYLGHSSASDPSAPEPFTEREGDVLLLLALGASNAEIARRLGVSIAAVQYHLTNIYGKLAVGSRAETIIKAVRQGLVVIEEA